RFTRVDAIPSVAAGNAERCLSAGDYDNDGRPDLFITGSVSSRLLHQRSDGTFEDVTRASQLPADLRPGAASWVDVDHDGDLDLVTAAPVRLYRNNRTGTFTDITREAGLTAAAGQDGGPAAI